MLGVVAAEAVKLRRSSALWFVLAGAFLPAVSSTMYFRHFDWSLHLTAAMLFLNLSSHIVVPSLAGYLAGGEYEKRTMGPVLTCPVSRITLLAAKYVVLAGLVACMYLISAGLATLGGFLRTGVLPPGPLSGRAGLALLGLGGMHLAIAPAGFLAGLLGRKTVVAVLVGLCFVLLYASFAFTNTGDYIPSCIPTVFIIHTTGVNPYGITHAFSAAKAAVALCVWLVVFSCLSVLAFLRMEHSRS